MKRMKSFLNVSMFLKDNLMLSLMICCILILFMNMNFFNMSRIKYHHTNILKVVYQDKSFESLVLDSNECWSRFKALSHFVIDNTWCGIASVSIYVDNVSIHPIVELKNYCV